MPSPRDKPLGTRAIQNHPKANGLERQLVEIPSPVGIRLTMDRTEDRPELSVEPVGTLVQEEKIAS